MILGRVFGGLFFCRSPSAGGLNLVLKTFLACDHLMS